MRYVRSRASATFAAAGELPFSAGRRMAAAGHGRFSLSLSAGTAQVRAAADRIGIRLHLPLTAI